MVEQMMINKDELAIWTWLVSRGISNSLSGLSQMIGEELSVKGLDVKHFPAKDAVDLLGGPEKLAVGIYLTIHGDAEGHLMLIHDPKIAFDLIDSQLGQPIGSTKDLGEMERSVLGEMGNITGSFFLNALADATNLTLTPSPPVVMVDMAGAILSIALTDIMQEQDSVLAVKASFGTATNQIDGTFMILPTMDFLRVILRHAGAR
ncbi:MAG: chemotaxis protein CheC [Dehalococcoidales bacterium]